MERAEVIREAGEQAGAIVMHSDKWKYPSQGDDPIKNPMLKFMLDAEQRAGTLIFIPDAPAPPVSCPTMSKADLKGKEEVKDA